MVSDDLVRDWDAMTNGQIRDEIVRRAQERGVRLTSELLYLIPEIREAHRLAGRDAALEEALYEDCPECEGTGGDASKMPVFTRPDPDRARSLLSKIAKKYPCPHPLCGKHGAKPGKVSKIALARDEALEEAVERLKKESAHRRQGLMEESRIYGYALDEAAAVLRALKSNPKPKEA